MYELTNGQIGTTCRPRARMSSSAPATSRAPSPPALDRGRDFRVDERDAVGETAVEDPADEVAVQEQFVAGIVGVVSHDHLRAAGTHGLTLAARFEAETSLSYAAA
jgi:hypothetical protein